MTGKDLVEWLAAQPEEVLALEVRITDDAVTRFYPVMALYPVHGDGKQDGLYVMHRPPQLSATEIRKAKEEAGLVH